MPSFSSFNIANEQSCQQTRFVVTWQEGLYFCQEQENDVLFPQPCFPHHCKMYENHSNSLLSQVCEWSEQYFQNYMLPKIKNWKWDFFGHFQTVCIVLNLPWQRKKIFWSEYHFTVFQNHRKGLIQHCERSKLRLQLEWTKVH